VKLSRHHLNFFEMIGFINGFSNLKIVGIFWNRAFQRRRYEIHHFSRKGLVEGKSFTKSVKVSTKMIYLNDFRWWQPLLFWNLNPKNSSKISKEARFRVEYLSYPLLPIVPPDVGVKSSENITKNRIFNARIHQGEMISTILLGIHRNGFCQT
jgi:hypothetical protein